MKLAMILLTLIPAIGWADGLNFNEIIAENSQAQREIQDTMKLNAQSTTAALGPNIDHKVVMESAAYNAPTGHRTLKYKKEVSEHRPSSKKELNRLANDFKIMERDI